MDQEVAYKELDRLMDMNIAIQNRLRAIDRFAWPGLEHVLPDNVAPIMRWFREHWYEPNWINRWLAERNNYRNNIEEERQRGRRGSQRSDGVCWS